MNKQQKKNLLSVLGIVFLVGGVGIAIPSFLQANFLALIGSGFSVIIGSILLALAFGT